MSTLAVEPIAAAAPAQKRWLAYADAMRIWAMVAVVVGHVADMPLFVQPVGSTPWWASNIVDALCRWAVPVYIMLSGALLLETDKALNLRDFYLRRFTRVGVPLIVWTALYMAFDVYYTEWRTAQQAWMNLLHGSPYAHLHFLYVIVGLYLFSPMLRVLVANAPRHVLWLTVVLALIAGVGNSVASVITHSPPNLFLRFVPFIGYFLAGYLLRDVRLGRGGMIGCLMGALACAACVAVSTWWLAMHLDGGQLRGYPSWSMLMYDFLSLPRVIMAFCVWALLVNLFRNAARPDQQRWITRELAAATFGIYLIHPAIRDALHIGVSDSVRAWLHGTLGTGGIEAMWPNIWIGLPLVSVVIYGLSFLLTMGLRRTPGVKWAVG